MRLRVKSTTGTVVEIDLSKGNPPDARIFASDSTSQTEARVKVWGMRLQSAWLHMQPDVEQDMNRYWNRDRKHQTSAQKRGLAEVARKPAHSTIPGHSMMAQGLWLDRP